MNHPVNNEHLCYIYIDVPDIDATAFINFDVYLRAVFINFVGRSIHLDLCIHGPYTLDPAN